MIEFVLSFIIFPKLPSSGAARDVLHFKKDFSGIFVFQEARNDSRSTQTQGLSGPVVHSPFPLEKNLKSEFHAKT